MGSKSSKDDDDPAAPSTGMTIAIVVQSFLILFLVGFLIWFAFFHKKKHGNNDITDAMKTISIPTKRIRLRNFYGVNGHL